MNKSELQKLVNGLNDGMLENTDKKLLLLKISNDYYYNKAIAIVDRNINTSDWYAIDDKYCCKTWDELEAYIDGFCKGQHTHLEEHER